MVLKWGIISTGKISNDFVYALRHLSFEIIAVGASSKEKADQFAKHHGIPLAYGSYKDVATNPSIDVVYVGAINTLHHSISKMLLEHGKHVLCEKPLCLNYAHANDLIMYAKEKKLFLMEGVWSRCFPLYDELRLLLSSSVIGDVIYVEANMGFPISEVPRLKKKELGGGTVFDLGVYVLQLAILIFGNDVLSVHAVGHLNEEGVDENVNYILKYPNGRTASLCTHSKIQMENNVIIYGTKGLIEIIDPFWCPTKINRDGEERTFPLPSMNATMNFKNSEGLIYEAEEVESCIMKGLLESPKMTHNESLAIAKIQQEVCSQLTGVNLD